MTEVSILKQFYRLNGKIRSNYLDKLSSLAAQELHRDRGASHPSILDIFIHILDGYDFWFGNVLSGTHSEYSERKGSLTRIDEVREFENRIGQMTMDYVNNLSEADLDKEIRLPWEGAPATRLGDICWHMVEEELQHRGEINALLWQMDIDPPIADYRDWLDARQEG